LENSNTINLKEVILDWFTSNYESLWDSMEECKHTHSDGTPNPYHLENSIKAHTLMVYEEIKSDNPNLLFSALLHDIGKMDARYEKNSSRVSFRDHENISMVKSIDILNKAKEVFDIDVLLVLQIIAWHGMLWTKRGETTDEQCKRINEQFSFDKEFYPIFLEFVKADSFGRLFADENEEIRVMEEMEFLSNYIPYPANEYSKHKPQYELITLVGISGSGKSTWLDNHSEYADYSVVSVDKYLSKGKLDYNSVNYKKSVKKAHNQTLIDIKEIVAKGSNTVIDMTNLTRETRRKKLSKFPSTQYKKIAIVFLKGLKEIESNLNKRTEKSIPKDAITKQIKSYELPSYIEFDEIRYIFY